MAPGSLRQASAFPPMSRTVSVWWGERPREPQRECPQRRWGERPRAPQSEPPPRLRAANFAQGEYWEGRFALLTSEVARTPYRFGLPQRPEALPPDDALRGFLPQRRPQGIGRCR